MMEVSKDSRHHSKFEKGYRDTELSNRKYNKSKKLTNDLDSMEIEQSPACHLFDLYKSFTQSVSGSERAISICLQKLDLLIYSRSGPPVDEQEPEKVPDVPSPSPPPEKVTLPSKRHEHPTSKQPPPKRKARYSEAASEEDEESSYNENTEEKKSDHPVKRKTDRKAKNEQRQKTQNKQKSSETPSKKGKSKKADPLVEEYKPPHNENKKKNEESRNKNSNSQKSKKHKKIEQPRSKKSSPETKPKSSEKSSKSESSDKTSSVVVPVGHQVAALVQPDEWILATIKKFLPSKNSYEVEDVDDEDPRKYVLPLSAVIPLPTAEPNPKTGFSIQYEFHKDSEVLAIFPNTTCFYRATVIALPNSRRRKANEYLLKFEDDEDDDGNTPSRHVTPLHVLPRSPIL